MIAMELSCHPSLLIADEPTTALDVTIQAQILRLISDLQSKVGMAVILITHNLGIVAQTARRVAVMYMGKIVETGLSGRIARAQIINHTHLMAVCGQTVGQRRPQE